MKTSLLNVVKTSASIILLGLLASCTSVSNDSAQVQSTVAQAPSQSQVPAQPQVNVTEALTPQPSQNVNALATQTQPTPAQNVTEAQLQQQAALTSTPEVAQPVAPLDTSNALSFLPFEGAPQSKVSNLNRLLTSSAQSNGLTILPRTRAGAKYRVKGYFSALDDGNGTLLVYVWDVVDGTGRRLHRINGRERTGTSRSDPWQAISDRELQRVADSTTERLKSWVATQ